MPDAPVALVLGTKVDTDGNPSPFLAARLEIARRLFDAGKVRAILVSGDNMNADYNEPAAMLGWLVDRGVPARKVVLDHAGFDTYDSCARAERIFGVRRATVVTQSFHLPRAVALCRGLGIDASGVGDDSAKTVRADLAGQLVPGERRLSEGSSGSAVPSGPGAPRPTGDGRRRRSPWRLNGVTTGAAPTRTLAAVRRCRAR